MSVRSKSFRWLAFSISALVVGLALWLTPAVVSAQDSGVPESSGCFSSSETSCCACHAESRPVRMASEWHAIHARQDCCRNCHGGNDRAIDKDQAHVEMIPHPLDDIYLSCHQCHPDDYQQRANRIAIALDITPKSSAPITDTMAIQPPDGEPTSQPLAAKLSRDSTDPTAGLIALVVIGVVLLVGGIVMWRKLAH